MQLHQLSTCMMNVPLFSNFEPYGTGWYQQLILAAVSVILPNTAEPVEFYQYEIVQLSLGKANKSSDKNISIIRRLHLHFSSFHDMFSGLGVFVIFLKKIKKIIVLIKIRLFIFKSDFLISFNICSIYIENWTNLNRKENILIKLLTLYPYFQIYSLIFILVNF